MTSASINNTFVSDGKLYIVPTLTSDVYGIEAITNGLALNFTADGTCTAVGDAAGLDQACTIFSNSTAHNISVIPPITSARLTTRLSKSIRFGRVEIKAKLPTGDWIWPASLAGITIAVQNLKHEFKRTFWSFGGLAATTAWSNAAVQDPWSVNGNAAPFDQDFFLILNVAVGGTNGWFSDVEGKPWSNGAEHPALDFWNGRSKWYPTWPADPKERGMEVEYVKMWRIAEPGEVCAS
ncbi:hypothetical protein RQP46_011299 [Phenoliferia psychrophenolica]